MDTSAGELMLCLGRDGVVELTFIMVDAVAPAATAPVRTLPQMEPAVFCISDPVPSPWSGSSASEGQSREGGKWRRW